MDMQDKELDELFHSKLNNFEVEPSAEAWYGIDNELHPGKHEADVPVIRHRNTQIVRWLSIAASIILLVAAGILFIPQKQNNPVKNKIAKAKPTIIIQQATKQGPKPDTLLNTVAILHNNTIAKRNIKSNYIKSRKSYKNTSPVIDSVPYIKTNEQPELASASPKEHAIIKPVVPDEATQITLSDHVKENSSFTTKPALTAVQLPSTDKQDDIPVKRKHTIRSLGDLVNVVLAKVDKRKDKLIEFSNTDDDESTITGVNLGIVRIKKDK